MTLPEQTAGLALSNAFEDQYLIDPGQYNESYYLTESGDPQNTFAFMRTRTLPRAQAIADTMQLDRGEGRILDYGCGLGAMTAGFSELGYDATGVDPSICAIEKVVEEAKDCVHWLDSEGLSAFGDDEFDAAVAKDVFEHIPEAEIPIISEDLLRVAGKVLLVIPTVGEDSKFIFPLYENDPTHITRLTSEGWRQFFKDRQFVVTECPDLTSKIRRADKIAGTVCMLLTRTP